MLITAAILSGLIASPLGSPLHVATGCDANLAAAGLCGESNGTVLDISQTHQDPGTDNTNNSSGGTNPGTGTPFPPCVMYLNERCVDYIFQRAEEASPGAPTITITDLASFAPKPTALAVEPGNAGIANMPANFLAAESVHTQTGTLFDIPLTVRFTPIAYDYTYGDGTTATITTPGRSWADLGQAQFTPTPTSHVYMERGTYEADVDVRYTAEIDFGLGWYPVSGELTSDGPSQQIQIFEAHTALVAHTCTERPTAPGC
ncbi:hypothetical protein RS84_00308 [Microbacterium hydrocarbonoxydans]|uniref:PKD domain-containing protein n=1 Tax=Microbacterium hydrocarbonoxydans TaxID=273678 RepID=A0A0M2HR79_9MICO|nr:hypothetical protein [Microbacterium hydrocarbonoxydans]KJL49196.1 hypothetical protein RS84_00308 [Microbacterium hydrocarbonoxydans]